MQAFDSPPPMAVRFAGDGHGGQTFANVLTEAQLQPRPVGFLDDAFYLDAGERSTVRGLDLFQQGAIALQAAASMAAVCALSPEPEQDVLDLCAAPGGKTALLHRLMAGTGRLVANDSSRRRLGRLRNQLRALNIEGVQLLCQDGAALGRDLAGCFDRVLVDVPCSGTGRWHGGNPAAWASWTPSTARGLARRQVSLLRAALRMVRPGGTVVYSTCTLAPEENEGVVSAVLKKSPVDVSCVPLPFALNAARKAVTTWMERDYATQVVNCCRIAPSCEGMTGFFIAVLRRS